MPKEKEFVLWFKDLGIEDVPLVGGKNASLGEMYQNLGKKGVNVPNGFAVTAYAYRYFLKNAKIGQKIKDILSDLDKHNTTKFFVIVKRGNIPSSLKKEKTGIAFKTKHYPGALVNCLQRLSKNGINMT